MVLNPVPDVLGFAPGSEKRDSSQGAGADRGAKNSLAPDHGVKDRLIKSRFFDHAFKDDILLLPNDVALLNTSLARLARTQKVIGYGNFSLLNFDDAVVYAKSYSRIGRFSKAELFFLEKFFMTRLQNMGLWAKKPLKPSRGK